MTFPTNDSQGTADKHRAAAVELLDIAESNDNPRPMDALVPAIVHALLAIDARLKNPTSVTVRQVSDAQALTEMVVEASKRKGGLV